MTTLLISCSILKKGGGLQIEVSVCGQLESIHHNELLQSGI